MAEITNLNTPNRTVLHQLIQEANEGKCVVKSFDELRAMEQ